MTMRLRWKWIGLSAWIALLILLFYGSALTLPFLADDYFHLPFVDSHSIADMWRTAGGLYYFRPVSFTLWKIMEPIFGYHNAVAQHALNLALHWVNALLTAWLAGIAWSQEGRIDWRRRYLSATLFVLFPFSYQAVPWIGSLVHPLVTTFVLASCLGYLKYRSTQRRAWALVSFGFAVLAPFVHENGILVGPLIAMIELTQPRRQSESLWRRGRRVLLWFLPVLLWWGISHAVPVTSSGDGLALRTLNTMLRNELYLAQGASYPAAWLGGWLSNALAADPFVVAAGLSVVALAAAALVQWRTGADRRSLLPWLWFGIASLPAIMFLPYRYVSISPRMLMLASVGSVWLWTDVLVRLADWGAPATLQRRLGRVAAVGLGVLVLAQNSIFIRDRMQVYQLGGAVVEQVAATVKDADVVSPARIYINLPGWIAPVDTVYALGTEGVLLLPSYAPLIQSPAVDTGQPAAVSALRFDAIRQDVPYYVGLREAASDWGTVMKQGGSVFVTRYAPDQIRLQPVGALNAVAPVTQPLAYFDQFVSLLGATATRTADGLQVNLIWQAHESPPADVTIFVHVLDKNGQLIAQADGDAFGGSYPFGQWPEGLTVSDLRTLAISDPNVSVRVGLYNRATGERLTARTSAGEALPDHAVPIPLQEQVP